MRWKVSGVLKKKRRNCEFWNFPTPMIFLASPFGAPCPKKEQKKFLRPCFWSLAFFILGLRFGGLVWISRCAALFGSRAETGNKTKRLGPRFLNFGAWRFWGPWALWDPRWNTETGNKKNVWGPAFWCLAFYSLGHPVPRASIGFGLHRQ